jgi:hypothetical protein
MKAFNAEVDALYKKREQPNHHFWKYRIFDAARSRTDARFCHLSHEWIDVEKILLQQE